MRVKINGTTVEKFPYADAEIRADFPNVSFPRDMAGLDLAYLGAPSVRPTPPPQLPFNRVLVGSTAALINGEWVEQWTDRGATVEEIEQQQKILYDSIVSATQERMDKHAQEHGYDGILSACTYATSMVARFQAEAQYCVNLRDATWATLFTIKQAVQAGSRPIPTGYAEIEPELPPLNWPQV